MIAYPRAHRRRRLLLRAAIALALASVPLNAAGLRDNPPLLLAAALLSLVVLWPGVRR